MNTHFAFFFTIAGLAFLNACGPKQAVQKEVEQTVAQDVLRSEEITDKEDFTNAVTTEETSAENCDETEECAHCNCGHDHK
jgi:hypothetical protein